jgi:hypothetical protein
VGAVAIARRRGGDGLMVATAVALALMCRSFSSESLHDIFNPSAPLLPFTLLVFACWSVACGEVRLLPLVVLLASFAVQCHLAFAAPSLGVLAVAVGGLLVHRPGPIARWVLAAVAVGLVCWSAPLVDEIAHRPGNVSALLTAGTSGQPTEGTRPAVHAVVRAVGLPPRWLRAPGATAGRIGGISGGDYGDTRIPDISSAPSRADELLCVLLLTALVAVAGLAFRRGRAELAAGALIGLVLCVALAADVAATPLVAMNTLGYTLWWGSVAGMWVWLILAWAVAAALPTPDRRWRPALVACSVLVVGAGAAVASAEPPDEHAPFYRPTAALAARLDAAVPSGRTVRLTARGPAVIPVSPAIRFALRRRGVTVLGLHAERRVGSSYRLDHRRVDEVVAVDEGDGSGRVVGRVTVSTAAGPELLTATLSSGRSPRRPARPRSPARPRRRATHAGRRRP